MCQPPRSKVPEGGSEGKLHYCLYFMRDQEMWYFCIHYSQRCSAIATLRDVITQVYVHRKQLTSYFSVVIHSGGICNEYENKNSRKKNEHFLWVRLAPAVSRFCFFYYFFFYCRWIPADPRISHGCDTVGVYRKWLRYSASQIDEAPSSRRLVNAQPPSRSPSFYPVSRIPNPSST